MTAPTHSVLQPMTGQACQWMKNRQRRYGHTCAAGHSRLSVVLLDASRTLLFSNSLLKTGIFLTSAHEYNRVAWSQSLRLSVTYASERAVLHHLYRIVHLNQDVGTCTYHCTSCVHRYANLSITHYRYCIKEVSCRHSPNSSNK